MGEGLSINSSPWSLSPLDTHTICLSQGRPGNEASLAHTQSHSYHCLYGFHGYLISENNLPSMIYIIHAHNIMINQEP